MVGPGMELARRIGANAQLGKAKAKARARAQVSREGTGAARWPIVPSSSPRRSANHDERGRTHNGNGGRWIEIDSGWL